MLKPEEHHNIVGITSIHAYYLSYVFVLPSCKMVNLEVLWLEQQEFCYSWNNKSYVLTLAYLNFQCATNPITSFYLGFLGQYYNYYEQQTY